MRTLITAVALILLAGCGGEPTESTVGSTSTVPSMTDTTATSTTGSSPVSSDPMGTQYGGTSATDTSSTVGRQNPSTATSTSGT